MERSKRLESLVPLVVLLALMAAAGIGLRFFDLGYPNRLTWDEHHFVKNARNYLAGRADWNDHPPLGKLLIALSMSRLGDTAFSFRLPSAIFGSLSVLAAGGLAWGVFRNRLAAGLAAAFIAVDGFFISYSRTALLDGMLTTMSLSALFMMTLRSTWAPLAAGALIGTTMAIKMSGVVLFGPLLALSFVRGLAHTKVGEKIFGDVDERTLLGRSLRVPLIEVLNTPTALLVGVWVYIGWWMVGLDLAGQKHGILDAVAATRKMMEGHAQATQWEHPLLSRWWTWALPTRPIVLRRDITEDGMVRMLTTMGNPLLWWSVVGAVVWSLVDLLRLAFAGFRENTLERVWLLLAYVAFLAPWIVTNRDSYIYHYLPAYSVGMVLLAGTLATVATARKRRLYLTAAVGAVFVVSAFYAPVWAQVPLSPAAVELRPLVHGVDG